MIIVHSDNAGESIEPNRSVTADDEITSVPKAGDPSSVFANEDVMDVLDDDDGGGGGLMVNYFINSAL